MEKILVVEDDADIQEVLKNYLMAEGYEVRLAEDGVEGLAAFQSWGPACQKASECSRPPGDESLVPDPPRCPWLSP